MAIEIRILSGARKGERIVLEGTEFRVGGDSRCGIFFDPRFDASARGRSVILRLASDGWRIESTGAGEVLLNQTPVVKETPIRSGDLVRLSEFGPDFSFAVTSRAAAVVDSAGTVSATTPETPSEVRASAAAEPDTGRGDAAHDDAAAGELSQPMPDSLGNRWKSSVWTGAAVAGAILLAMAAWNRTDQPADLRPAAPMSDGPNSTGVDANSGVVKHVPPDTADDRLEAAVDVGDAPQPTPEVETMVELTVKEDPWARVENELRAALFIVQIEVSGAKGNFSWPFCTCFAIGDHTLLTSGREVLQLAGFHRQGYRIWAVNPATGFKTAVPTLRVPQQFADLWDTPGDWIYFNFGLLVTEEKLPKSVSFASPEELQDLEEGLPVACFGFPHDGGKITRFDSFEPELARGEIYLIDSSPGLAGGPRLLELKAKIAENMYGSPILNQQGEVIAVYGEAVSAENIGVADLHYAPVLNHELLRSWLEETNTGRWVVPSVPEMPSTEQHSSPTQLN